MREPSIHQPFLLIPGPVEVHPEVAAAAARPMIGHRGPQIRALLADVLGRVGAMLHTEAPVLPLASSATGAMEAAIRNAGPGPFLHLVNGAFSQRWSQLRAACGMEGDELHAPWGEAVGPEQLEAALARRDYGAVTLVHSETSTGVLQPLAELAAVVRRVRPEALVLVDTVTSMAAVELDLDRWGVDVCFAGTQKAWGLPPGLTLCSVSARALERSRGARAKGLYFDFVEHVEFLERWETPSTPPVSLLFQLQVALDRIEREGWPARYARHRALQARVESWADGRFGFLPPVGLRSPALSVVVIEPLRPEAILAAMRERGWWVGGGYGPTKDRCLRIGHMGELDPVVLDRALDDLDAVLAGPAGRPAAPDGRQ